MKSLNLLFLVLLLTTVFISSCEKDDACDDVLCPTGQICSDGECIEDPNFDPCQDVVCDEGEECVNGNCVAVGEVTHTGSITSDITWNSNQIHILNGKVVVENNATLTIMPGTIIKGAEGTAENASALIIARGAKIEACGTQSQPIIFTSVLDNIQLGQRDGGNLDEFDSEKWGGLVILGRAPISAKEGDTEALIEGLPANEEFGKYGGNDVNDDSGSLCYVSIRHGGAEIGEGNEINGLTLGGVGAGTNINNIEVVATLDDGIEFFGGSVSVNNAIVSWQGDDAIDIDQNYSGTIDNFLIMHGGDDTDEALEIDGPENSTYVDGKFTLVNGTCWASDQTKTSPGDFKSGAQGEIRNLCFVGYGGKSVKIRASFDPSDCSEKSDSYSNLMSNDLTFMNNEYETEGADFVNVYSDDDDGEEDCYVNNYEATYQAAADQNFLDNNNLTVATCSGQGANTTQFDGWSLASIRNWY